ncbi:hypothetical protein ACJJTC_007780 [Scirpophaga incertulas]
MLLLYHYGCLRLPLPAVTTAAITVEYYFRYCCHYFPAVTCLLAVIAAHLPACTSKRCEPRFITLNATFHHTSTPIRSPLREPLSVLMVNIEGSHVPLRAVLKAKQRSPHIPFCIRNLTKKNSPW